MRSLFPAGRHGWRRGWRRGRRGGWRRRRQRVRAGWRRGCRIDGAVVAAGTVPCEQHGAAVLPMQALHPQPPQVLAQPHVPQVPHVPQHNPHVVQHDVQQVLQHELQPQHLPRRCPKADAESAANHSKANTASMVPKRRMIQSSSEKVRDKLSNMTGNPVLTPHSDRTTPGRAGTIIHGAHYLRAYILEDRPAETTVPTGGLRGQIGRANGPDEGVFGGGLRYTMGMAAAAEDARRRWFRFTPDRAIVALLALEGFLLLSAWFRWLPFNEHKGYTVLICLAAVGAALVLMFLWFLAALVFRLRFQFSMLSLMLLLPVVVAVPCAGWRRK